MITLKNIVKGWMLTPLSIGLLVACNASRDDALLTEKIEQENKAYEVASNNESIEALGDSVRNFPIGNNSIVADAEAWRITKRENSITAYKTYLASNSSPDSE